MNQYEIWIRGYSATGESEPHRRLLRDGEVDSKWSGVTFQQACVKALNELHWPMLYEALQGIGECYYDRKENSYWGRKFFDNEKDAKR